MRAPKFNKNVREVKQPFFWDFLSETFGGVCGFTLSVKSLLIGRKKSCVPKGEF
jgi:hypothetical protein